MLTPRAVRDDDLTAVDVVDDELFDVLLVLIFTDDLEFIQWVEETLVHHDRRLPIPPGFSDFLREEKHVVLRYNLLVHSSQRGSFMVWRLERETKEGEDENHLRVGCHTFNPLLGK